MSRMSAPSSIIARACATATAGSKNCPPTENESGVTLRMPITAGCRRASSAASGSCDRFGAAGMGLARVIIGWLCAGSLGLSRMARTGPRSVLDLERQGPGVLDPARDDALGGQEPHQLALAVGLGHRLGELGRIADLEVLDGVDAGGGEQLGVFLADAPDPHAVGAVRPAQKLARVEPGLAGKLTALLQRAGPGEQARRRANAERLQDGGNAIVDIRDIGDRIRHVRPAPPAPASCASDELRQSGNGADDLTAGILARL